MRFCLPCEGDKGLADFWCVLEDAGLSIEKDYYQRCLERQLQGEMEVLLAFLRENAAVVGFCLLNWQPKYAFFGRRDSRKFRILTFCVSIGGAGSGGP